MAKPIEAPDLSDADLDCASEDPAPPTRRPSRLLGLLWFLVALAPALVTGYFVSQNAVNVPLWDDWERGVLWEKFDEGTLNAEYLLSGHVQHRMAFTRLVALANGVLTGGDLRVDIYVTYALMLLGSLALLGLLRLTFGATRWIWGAWFAINLVVFCPVMYPVWLWAIMNGFVLPMVCLCLIAVLLRSRAPILVKFLLGALLALLGTFGFSPGLALWPVLVLLAALLRHVPAIDRLALVLFSGVVASGVFWFYLNWNYYNTAQPEHSYGLQIGETPSAPRILETIKADPDKVERYFLNSLGSPFARVFSTEPLEVARSVGRAQLVVFALLVLALLWRIRDARTWNDRLPWVAIGCFSVAVAFLLATGRGDLGLPRSYMPRYIAMNLYLGVAIVTLIAHHLLRWWQNAADDRARRVPACIAAGLLAAFAGMQWTQWVYGISRMEAWSTARHQARAALLYINFPELTDGRKSARIDSNIDFAREQANILNQHGLLDPPLFQKPDLGSFRVLDDPLGGSSRSRAAVSKAYLREGGWLDLAGHALLPGDKRPAHGVLISAREPGGEWRVLRFADIRNSGVQQLAFFDLQFAGGPNLNRADQISSWRCTARLDAIPQAGLEIQAWAMDTRRMVLYPIGRLLRVTPKTLPEQDLLQKRIKV